MKKRFVCAVLALMLLISLVPATALTASAASLSVSEGAITVLKQLEGYSQTCNAKGYIGYGTLCTESGTHGSHKINEKKADTALRAELKELDKAINNSGLSLTQSKHDALVLFSFQNGTAWLNGTGELKAAVANNKTGSDFLNVICNWSSTDNNNRRMIEANMYLYGVYSSYVPSKFISVTFDAGKGAINGQQKVVYYYDVSANPAPHLVPEAKGYSFTGWYLDTEYGQQRVDTLKASHKGATLTAGWTLTYSSDPAGESHAVSYVVISKAQLLDENLYFLDGEGKFVLDKNDKSETINVSKFCNIEGNAFWIDRDYLTEDGTRWCRIQGQKNSWVKVSNSSTASSSASNSIDVTVSVTNSYVNRRSEASIYSTKNGSYDLGAKLRIINTASADGFLWGQVAANTTGTESVGWVALMYTDFETVRSQSGSANTNNGTVVATGFITYKGYVNVRSDAGTDNKIVGALPYGTEVNIYQTKFVNGLEWGRTDSGWFCMSYANVTRKSNTVDTTDAGYISYAFTGTLQLGAEIRQTPNGDPVVTKEIVDGTVTVTNLVREGDITWGKISQGWVAVSGPKGETLDVKLHTAKYNVVSELTVREQPDTASNRVDVLTKGTEFNVNNSKQVIVVGDTIWGYADKVGENAKTYGGWVNLASKYVSRGDAPTIEADPDQNLTGKIGTIVGADSVRVRGDSTLSGVLLGSIARGTVVNVLGERNGWYMIDYKLSDDDSIDSWVYGQYIEVTEGSVSGSTGSTGSTNTTVSTEGTGIGIIANTYGGVNVRASAGTSGALKGKILPGTQVNILETKTVGSTKWGRVEQGWICMDYVQIISDLPQEVLDALLGTNNGTTGGSNSTTTGAETAIYTGKTNAATTVYKTTSVDSDVVRTLDQGANVTVHEILEVVTEKTGDPVTSGSTTSTTTTKTTSYWARVNDGYIQDPANNLNLDTLDEATYTVTGSDTLNVRNLPGVGEGSIVHKLTKGDQVKVTRLEIVAGNVWGFIESDGTDAKYETDEEGKTTEVESAWSGEGWISLAYTTKGAVAVKTENNTTTTTPSEPVIGSTGNTGSTGYVNNTSGYKYTGKVINANSVNVRATASTTASITTKLSNGASLVIYETTISESMAWGRCDAGWVYLYYVDLTPVNGAVDARVVYNDNTIAYTDVNCTEVAGTYAKMSVIDIYEIVGRMARTDLGWVSTDNLL